MNTIQLKEQLFEYDIKSLVEVMIRLGHQILELLNSVIDISERLLIGSHRLKVRLEKFKDYLKYSHPIFL